MISGRIVSPLLILTNKIAYLSSKNVWLKTVDLGYNSFFLGIRKRPKFKSTQNYSEWTYPAKSGWKANTDGKHGTLILNDLGITLRMREQTKTWDIPTTLTIVNRPNQKQCYASITVNIPNVKPQFGSGCDLEYKSMVAYDLGFSTALSLYNREEFDELENPRCLSTTSSSHKHMGLMKMWS